jgi:hypothetical protein
MPYNEAEQAFLEDIREKKKAASGVHHKTGKRGYVGTMRFPTDIMSRKDKYNYRKAGKCVVSNLYDEILTVEEFETLSTEDQRNRLLYWRTKYSNLDIMKKMGVPNAKYYSIVTLLDLPKANRTKQAPRKATTKIAAIQPAAEPQKGLVMVQTPEPVQTPTEVQEIIVNGIHFVFSGTYTPERIQNQLLKFAGLLDGESDEFYVELKLMQKPK